jgi:hypothetical protein
LLAKLVPTFRVVSPTDPHGRESLFSRPAHITVTRGNILKHIAIIFYVRNRRMVRSCGRTSDRNRTDIRTAGLITNTIIDGWKQIQDMEIQIYLPAWRVKSHSGKPSMPLN